MNLFIAAFIHLFKQFTVVVLLLFEISCKSYCIWIYCCMSLIYEVAKMLTPNFVNIFKACFMQTCALYIDEF